MEYDLIVIGAGPGGTPAAMAAAAFGKKVLLIDKREKPGGECLFEGCIPSKVLENAANKFALLKEAPNFHIDLSKSPQIHWEEVLKDKEAIIKKRAEAAYEQIQQNPNIDYIQGAASFESKNSIKVNSQIFTFKKALIATGAKVNLPPFKGNGIEKAWTNRDVFFEKELPEEIVFIGAGAISCELAGMFNKLGVKCTILERGERILKRLDKEAALFVQNKMIKNGIDIKLNVNLEKIDYENGKFKIYYNTSVLESKKVLLATGRIANLEGLNLEKASVEYDRHGVRVDSTLKSSNENIYACGDCINTPKFAHTATYEAGVAVHNMFAPNKREVNYDNNSWVLFTNPQIASVGIDEKEAEKRNIDIAVEKYDYKIDAKAQIEKKPFGFIKFVMHNNKIIGIQILSEDAESLIGEASLIVSKKMSPTDLLNTIHPHPTLTEGFGKLAQQIFFKEMIKRFKNNPN